jgi:hypothetical protein
MPTFDDLTDEGFETFGSYVRQIQGGLFVHAVRGWFRWHVDVRYIFGPFRVLVVRRSFRSPVEAEHYFRTVTPEQAEADARSRGRTGYVP